MNGWTSRFCSTRRGTLSASPPTIMARPSPLLAKDNPFVNTPGALPSIWTYGHRNPEGLTFDPATGIFWETEHGPTGGDEVNIIEPGKDYGWGVVTQGVGAGGNPPPRPRMTEPLAFFNT